MQESFRPISNTAPIGFFGTIKFYGRMCLDFHINTIFTDVKKQLPFFKGNVLDVGCGQSPYRFLLDKEKTTYFGIDIIDAKKFDYDNKDVTFFNGEEIPFENEKFDAFVCTEVFEHVQNFNKLSDELYRVCKTDAIGILTIPWSARFHYIPFDYFRYTPSALKTIFSKFKSVEITNRGTDVTSIIAKLVVMYFRNLFPKVWYKWFLSLIWLCLFPLFLTLVIIGHFSVWFNIGSVEDPLGYTIIVKK